MSVPDFLCVMLPWPSALRRYLSLARDPTTVFFSVFFFPEDFIEERSNQSDHPETGGFRREVTPHHTFSLASAAQAWFIAVDGFPTDLYIAY